MLERGNCLTCGAAVIYCRNVATGMLLRLDAAPDIAGDVHVSPTGEARKINNDLFGRIVALPDGQLHTTHQHKGKP
jgi:hypothetical protein